METTGHWIHWLSTYLSTNLASKNMVLRFSPTVAYKAAKCEYRASAPSPGFSISSGLRSVTHVDKSSAERHGHRLGRGVVCMNSQSIVSIVARVLVQGSRFEGLAKSKHDKGHFPPRCWPFCNAEALLAQVLICNTVSKAEFSFRSSICHPSINLYKHDLLAGTSENFIDYHTLQ